MLILSIFVVVLGLVQIIMFVHFSKVNENIDKLFHEALKHEGKLMECKNRLDEHYNDIVRNEKKIDSVEKLAFEASKKVETQKVDEVIATKEALETIDSNTAVDEFNERRNKYAEYRKQGMDIKSAGVAVGVSITTARRYEKWRVDNKK